MHDQATTTDPWCALWVLSTSNSALCINVTNNTDEYTCILLHLTVTCISKTKPLRTYVLKHFLLVSSPGITPWRAYARISFILCNTLHVLCMNNVLNKFYTLLCQMEGSFIFHCYVHPFVLRILWSHSITHWIIMRLGTSSWNVCVREEFTLKETCWINGFRIPTSQKNGFVIRPFVNYNLRPSKHISQTETNTTSTFVSLWYILTFYTQVVEIRKLRYDGDP
jgi:hypothetical protein